MQVKTVDDIVDALGGTVAVARELNISPSVVSMWRTRGAVPPQRHDTVGGLLKRRRIKFDPALFRQR